MSTRTIDFTRPNTNINNKDISGEIFIDYEIGNVNSDEYTININLRNINDEIIKCTYRYRTKEEIYQNIVEGEKIDLEGCYIKDFDYADIPKHTEKVIMKFDATYSFWDGKVSFFNANFTEGNASFFSAIFANDNIEFSGANFAKCNLDFGFSKFNLKKAFGHEDNQFENRVVFMNTNFGEGIVNFEGAIFGSSYVFFNNSIFENCEMRFKGANFQDAIVYFDNARFGNKNVSFYGIKAKEMRFIKNIFYTNMDFRFMNVEELIMQNCTINKDLNIGRCLGEYNYFKKLSFYETTNYGQIKIDWVKNNVKEALINGKDADLEEGLSSQYRMLRENYKKLGYHKDEDTVYREYMKSYTKELKLFSKAFLEKTFNILFGFISGFGTQVHRILITCLGVISILGGFYSIAFWDKTNCLRAIWKGMYFSTITFLTIGYGDVAPTTDCMAIVAGAEGFIGLLLMSIVTVVVVRKVIR